jgi:dipeptide transport system ATP-binding protein
MDPLWPLYLNEENAVAEVSGAPDAGNAHLLEVDNLVVEFETRQGVFRAVDGISLHLARGEILAVVGESGSGKSVLMHAILGLLTPGARVTADRIVFRGRDVLALKAFERRALLGKEIGVIFQDPIGSLNPCYTIGFQIDEILRRHTPLDQSARRDRTIAMLDRVGIPMPAERLSSFPHQMSGGQCQRVMIAMALACEPSLLIADEPTTALDVTIQKQILDLLMTLQRSRGMGMVIVTHNMGVVSEVADRVFVQYRGKMMECADVIEIFENPQSRYTQALLSALPENAVGTRLPVISGSF